MQLSLIKQERINLKASVNHKDFSVQELIDNSSFRRMVKGMATPEEFDQWNRWMELSDENRVKAREAASDILGFEIKSPSLPDIEKQWKQLNRKTSGKLNLNSYHTEKRHGGNENMLKWVIRAAAIILIAAVAGVGGLYFTDSAESVTRLQQLIEEKTISTAEGEQKTLTFSNGARVVLNSNSSITYRLGVHQNETIDVTLEGEAWFNVERNTSKKQPAFAVRTPDGIIRDIGTKFLVTIQNNQSRIVIQEGMVEVEPVNKQLEESGTLDDSFIVEMGEMVEFNRDNIIRREHVNTTLFTSWATGYLELSQTGLHEFANYIEERFSVKVQLNDSALDNITLNGTVYFRSLDELVRSVAEVTGIPAYRSTDMGVVYIGKINETTVN